MDPITHGITGALIGKGYFSKRQEGVAVFAATLGAVFPDVDVVVEAMSRDPLAIVKYHRAITHSFVALPFFAILLAWLVRLIARRRGIETPSWSTLSLICGVGLASHIILDGMTSFGTRMWTPISQQRVSWDLLFIVDFSFTAIVLLPQVVAWVYRGHNHAASRRRAFRMWALFSVAAATVWVVAYLAGYPFRVWAVVLAILLLAALFFLPEYGGWGFRMTRRNWCQCGTCVMVAYLIACGWAHHAAMLRVETFAEANHIAVVRIGALPIPPSLLKWGDVIRSDDGIYQAQVDMRHPDQATFEFVVDSPPDDFTARALQLPEVQLYWQFVRFPVIRTSVDGPYHIVDFGEHRFTNGGRHAPQPFSYRVEFDSSGEVVAEGFRPNGMFLQRLQRLPPQGAAR
jgi:membrane-bound metal-dependent hydrolase YbcI (DUF457 family)